MAEEYDEEQAEWRPSTQQLTLHGALHPRFSVDRLYVERKVGGRGLVSVEDLERHEEKQLNGYMTYSRETAMQAVYVTYKIKEAHKGESRVDKWTGKAMRRKLVRQTEEVRGEGS